MFRLSCRLILLSAFYIADPDCVVSNGKTISGRMDGKREIKVSFFCHPSLRHNNKLSLDHCRCIIIDWYSRNYVVHKKKASWRSHLRSNPTFCRKNVRKKLIKHKHREWIRNGYANSLYSDSKVHYWSSGDSMKTDLKLHTLNALLRQTPNRFGEITSQKSQIDTFASPTLTTYCSGGSISQFNTLSARLFSFIRRHCSPQLDTHEMM